MSKVSVLANCLLKQEFNISIIMIKFDPDLDDTTPCRCYKLHSTWPTPQRTDYRLHYHIVRIQCPSSHMLPSAINMASQTSLLNLNTQSTSTNKQACSTSFQSSLSGNTTQYILFSTPIDEPISTTHTNLQTALNTANLPQSLLSQPLPTCTISSASHANEKHIYVQLQDTSDSTQVLRVIQTAVPFSMPQLSPSISPSPTIDNIDTSAPIGPSFPCFYCITSCPYYYGGNDFFSNDEPGLLQAQYHGNNIHHSLLLSLLSKIISSIGWARCCHLCSAFFLTKENLSHHQSTCTILQRTLSPSTSPLKEGTCKQIYLLCPPLQHNNLDFLIASSPDADPQTLFAQATKWFLKSKCPMSSPASPHTTTSTITFFLPISWLSTFQNRHRQSLPKPNCSTLPS
jgi:hypothetical protein